MTPSAADRASITFCRSADTGPPTLARAMSLTRGLSPMTSMLARLESVSRALRADSVRRSASICEVEGSETPACRATIRLRRPIWVLA